MGKFILPNPLAGSSNPLADITLDNPAHLLEAIYPPTYKACWRYPKLLWRRFLSELLFKAIHDSVLSLAYKLRYQTPNESDYARANIDVNQVLGYYVQNGVDDPQEYMLYMSEGKSFGALQ